MPGEGVGVIPAESLEQVPAAHPFHHEKRISSILARGKKRDTVRVLDAGHYGQLANELLELFFGERTSVFGDFDGNNFAIENSLMNNRKAAGFCLDCRIQCYILAFNEREPVFESADAVRCKCVCHWMIEGGNRQEFLDGTNY